MAEWTTWAVAGHLDRPELLTVGRHLPPVAVECVPTCPSRHRGQAVPAGRVRELSKRKSALYCSNHWLWATTSRRRRRATCRLGSGRLALIWRAPVPPSSSAPSTCTTTPSSRIPTTFSFSSNSSKSTILPKSIRWILKSPRMSWGNVIFLLHSVENCNDLICWWRRQVRDGGLQRLVLAVAGSQVARSPFLPPDSHPALGAALPRVGCFSLMNERAPPPYFQRSLRNSFATRARNQQRSNPQFISYTITIFKNEKRKNLHFLCLRFRWPFISSQRSQSSLRNILLASSPPQHPSFKKKKYLFFLFYKLLGLSCSPLISLTIF